MSVRKEKRAKNYNCTRTCAAFGVRPSMLTSWLTRPLAPLVLLGLGLGAAGDDPLGEIGDPAASASRWGGGESRKGGEFGAVAVCALEPPTTGLNALAKSWGCGVGAVIAGHSPSRRRYW